MTLFKVFYRETRAKTLGASLSARVTIIAKVSLDWGALGRVLFTRRVGSGLYQSASILYHLTTARRWRSGDTQRFGVLYSKFEFAVQDAIKTPKLKPRSRKRVLG